MAVSDRKMPRLMGAMGEHQWTEVNSGEGVATGRERCGRSVAGETIGT